MNTETLLRMAARKVIANGNIDSKTKHLLELIPACCTTLNADTCLEAEKYDHVKCLNFGHKNGIKLTKKDFQNALFYGSIDCIKYLHTNKCPWDEMTCVFAVETGQLEILKYLHENGCPWDELTCSLAAGYGHVDCLKYAHERGCEWDLCTCNENNLQECIIQGIAQKQTDNCF